jgi:hypothetical protein
MVLYDAESLYFDLFGRYTTDLAALAVWAPENVLAGNCTRPLVIYVAIDGSSFEGTVTSRDGTRVAHIDDERYLYVTSF